MSQSIGHCVCIVQARLSSTRLPAKVLCDIAGRPMLSRVMQRLQRSRKLGTVIIATSVDASDDALAQFCQQQRWPVFRGNLNDVLDRYYQAARQFEADTIVRVTSDCPLIDPHVVDEVIACYESEAADYASNALAPRTYPRGLDTEVFSMAALERAWSEDRDPRTREHVTPYIHQNGSLFKLAPVVNDCDYSHLRWTVDTPADLELVRRIYQAMGDDDFAWTDVISRYAANPSWKQVNDHVAQKTYVWEPTR